MLAYLIDFRRQLTVSTLSGGLPIKSSKSGLLLFVLGPSRILGTVVLSGANCRHRLSKRILEVPMKAQHFARNILAAAVLSALGAHAAVAADFSEGVYENRGEQQEFENFTVKNADGADLDNSAGVFIRNMGTDKGSLTVKQQFRVDVSSTETPAQVLKGVHVESESRSN